ncbi:hypothetical protein ACFTXM_39650 [Streptomyces sp. NPDC056930]|uniref:hypothetical protein n=1 Tax=Streptomyces sp. NPDC056930 TaxID=3345967 RepID=UPI003632A56B
METMPAYGARIHSVQRSLAVGAVLVAVPALLLGLDSYFAALFVLTAMPVTVPIFLQRSPESFNRACMIVGLALVVWGVLGVFLGMFLYLPSALLLVLAALADPRRRPVAARVMGGAGGLVMAGVVVASALWCWHFYISPSLATPHTFRAVTDPGGAQFDGGIGDAQERLRKFGATSVTGTETDEISYLEVRFADDLSEPQRAELKEQIAVLPGVSRVELCSVRDCG